MLATKYLTKDSLLNKKQFLVVMTCYYLDIFVVHYELLPAYYFGN